MHRWKIQSVVALFGTLFIPAGSLCPTALAGDWPQIHGPSRNGHAVNEKLATNWSLNPPEKAWAIDVGEGYAGVAVKSDRVLIFHRKGAAEILTCVSANDGKDIWATDWKTSYSGGIDSDRGPRCVPLVSNDRVFVFGAGGDLHCVAFTSGEKQWSRQLAREYKAQEGYFGFGSTPIVLGTNLLVNVGGKNETSIVAVDIETGKTRWTKFDDQASYSTPAYWPVAGKPHALFITRLNLVGIEPVNGKIIFQLSFGARGPTVNAAAPLLVDNNHVFLTASYRIGAKLIRLTDPTKPTVVWESDDKLSSQFPTPVLLDGQLFGVHGRDDGPPASLRCIDPMTGKIHWERSSVGMAHFIVADGQLLMIASEGELVLIAPSATKYTELGRIRLVNATIRALPALSNGRLYIRDLNGKVAAWSLHQ